MPESMISSMQLWQSDIKKTNIHLGLISDIELIREGTAFRFIYAYRAIANELLSQD